MISLEERQIAEEIREAYANWDIHHNPVVEVGGKPIPLKAIPENIEAAHYKDLSPTIRFGNGGQARLVYSLGAFHVEVHLSNNSILNGSSEEVGDAVFALLTAARKQQ